MIPSRILPGFAKALLALICMVSCNRQSPEKETSPETPASALAKVGSITILQSDLDHRLKEHYSSRTDASSREAALADLVKRAQFSQAALDAGMAEDPIVRDELSRFLAARLRERELNPKLEKQQEISEERLKELYQNEITRFQAPEKRQVAVLWLNPGIDPDKAERYAEKMQSAREFFLQSQDLIDHPEKGFSVLSIDHSEHQASRYKGGVIGWLEAQGGIDKWTKAVAEIAFSVEPTGSTSEIIVRPEGVFLVRLMEIRPAITRPFEAVAPQLGKLERERLRQEVEAAFERDIETRYPVKMGAP